MWTTTFDNVQTSVGLKVTQEIGRSPMPVADESAVYICDFSKDVKAIKKLDINNGKEIWRSEKISSSDIVSQILVIDNALIAKFGGIIRKEKYINMDSGTETYKVEYEYEGSTSIKAFDIKTGQIIWTSEKIKNDDNLSKSESNIIRAENKVAACSDKLFYLIDAATGNVVSKTELGKAIGKPKNMFEYNNSFVVEGSEGIATFDKAGTRKYAQSTDKCIFSEFRGDAYIIWVGKDADDLNEFIRFDLETGKTMGILKGTYYPRFDKTGNYFIRFKDEQVTKFSTM